MKMNRFHYKIIATALLLLLSASAAMAFQNQSDASRIRVESALVTVPVLINDPDGHFLYGLSSDKFRLFQDAAPADISLFLTSEDPIKIALLLDASQSTAPVLDKIKQAARRFLLQLRPKDLAMVVSFNSEIQVLCPLSSDQKELRAAIQSAKVGGMNTRVRDAISEIAQKRFRSLSGRKAIVLLTDGEDHGSRISGPDMLKEVASSSSIIYSVFYRVDPRQVLKKLTGVSRIPITTSGGPDASKEAWEKREREATAFLEKISELSAGRVYRSGVSELDLAFKEISEELRSQYLLGFYPDESKLDGELHSIDVRVTVPGSIVRSRRSYRAVR
jgi:Ca-activated chloride channel homolog